MSLLLASPSVSAASGANASVRVTLVSETLPVLATVMVYVRVLSVRTSVLSTDLFISRLGDIMVTINEHELMFQHSSVAVHITSLSPNPKIYPSSEVLDVWFRLCVAVGILQLSVRLVKSNSFPTVI